MSMATTPTVVKVGENDLAKYPFLGESADYLREQGFTWEVFAKPEYSRYIVRARNRVITASKGEVDTELADFREELFTFLAGLIIVKLVGRDAMIKRFALHEARRIERFLQADLDESERRNRKTGRDLVLQILAREFNVHVRQVEIPRTEYDEPRTRKAKRRGEETEPTLKTYAVTVPEFLMATRQFADPEWKLINQAVDRGLVYLDIHHAIRLVRKELQTLIVTRIRQMKNLPELELVGQVMRDSVELVKEKTAELYPENDYRNGDGSIVLPSVFPPCVRKAIEMMANGENVPHRGRMLLATYMIAGGKSDDEIVEYFRGAPDFKESNTRYHIGHLRGEKGGRTAYSVPACEGLKAVGWCFEDKGCIGIRSPKGYGEEKKKQ